jgi:hypothetical protein
MGMLSFLTPKGADKALDAIVKGGDALVLTKEEKLQYTQKAMQMHIDLTSKIAQESTPTAISRRVCGLMVLVPFAFLTVGGAIIFPLSEAVSEQWLEIAKLFEWPSLAVVGFYFGGHIAKSLKS